MYEQIIKKRNTLSDWILTITAYCLNNEILNAMAMLFIIIMASCQTWLTLGSQDSMSRLKTHLQVVNDVIEKRKDLATADPLSENTVNINVWFNLMFIMDLNERKQALTTSGWLDFWWEDPRYAWNETEYGGVGNIIVANNKVWKPDVIVRNAVKSFEMLGEGDERINVFSRGYIEWSPLNIYETICKVNIRNFPFDAQTCYLNISSWMYYPHQLVLKPYDEGVILRHYEENSEWRLVSLTFEEAYYNYSYAYQKGITYVFKIQRRSTFYVIKLLIPTVLLSLLNAFVFIVPVESGERVSISVTTMLSLTVFLSYIGDVMPNNSQNVPVIALFVVLHLSLGALSIVCNIFTLNYHFRRNSRPRGDNLTMRLPSVYGELHNGKNLGVDKDDDNNNEEHSDKVKPANRARLRRRWFLSWINLDKLLFMTFIVASFAVTFFAVISMISAGVE